MFFHPLGKYPVARAAGAQGYPVARGGKKPRLLLGEDLILHDFHAAEQVVLRAEDCLLRIFFRQRLVSASNQNRSHTDPHPCR